MSRQVQATSAGTTYQNSIESDKLSHVDHDVTATLLDEPKQAITVRVLATDPSDAIDQVNAMTREQALAKAVPDRAGPREPHPAGNTPGYWSPTVEYRA